MALMTRQIPLGDVVPGMVLAKDVLSARGQVMLSEGMVVTAAVLERLRNWGFETITVLERTGTTREVYEKGLLEAERFQRQYARVEAAVKDILKEARESKKLPAAEVSLVAEEIVETLLENRGVLKLLRALQDHSDHTYQHSASVAVLNGMIGLWLGLSPDKIRTLTAAGLMHDVGKTQIPLEILDKADKLYKNELDLLRQHPLQGKQLLERSGVTDEEILAGVFQHHERLDGSGYPRGLKGKAIHPVARITAVADIFDAMIGNRNYRNVKFNVFHVMRALSQESFGQVDYEVSAAFVRHLQDDLTGSVVLLDDGQHATIVHFDKDRSVSPLVQTEAGDFIDLERRRDVNITEILTL